MCSHDNVRIKYSKDYKADSCFRASFCTTTPWSSESWATRMNFLFLYLVWTACSLLSFLLTTTAASLQTTGMIWEAW